MLRLPVLWALLELLCSRAPGNSKATQARSNRHVIKEILQDVRRVDFEIVLICRNCDRGGPGVTRQQHFRLKQLRVVRIGCEFPTDPVPGPH